MPKSVSRVVLICDEAGLSAFEGRDTPALVDKKNSFDFNVNKECHINVHYDKEWNVYKVVIKAKVKV